MKIRLNLTVVQVNYVFRFLFGAWDLMLCTLNCMYIF
jgi:hypothetical protein